MFALSQPCKGPIALNLFILSLPLCFFDDPGNGGPVPGNKCLREYIRVKPGEGRVKVNSFQYWRCKDEVERERSVR